MRRTDYLAVLVAAVAAFVASVGYYIVLGEQYAEVSAAAREAAASTPPLWQLPVELLRSLVVAAVVGWLAARSGVTTWLRALLLAVVLWVGFPLVLWVGAVIHEQTPVQLALIHGGDWLVKLLIVSVIIGVWRGRRLRRTSHAHVA